MLNCSSVKSLVILSAALLLTACHAKETTSTSTTSASTASSTQTKVIASSSKKVEATASSTATVASSSEEITTEETSATSSEVTTENTVATGTTTQATGTATGVYVIPFPEALLGTWEKQIADNGVVHLTFAADGSVVKEYIENGEVKSTWYSVVENSEQVGEGLYRFNNISGDRDVVAGGGLGGGFPIEVGISLNADGTIDSKVWSFENGQARDSYVYNTNQGIQMTRVQ